MQHYWSIDNISIKNSVLSIGSFDGVHRGHQEIVKRLVSRAEANNSTSVVITFFPHPAVVLRKRTDPFYLTTPEERADLLGDLGVDYVITLPFNKDIAAMSARAFVTRLIEHLHPSLFCVGHDFALGKNREGDVQYLMKLGLEFGYQLEVAEPVAYNEVIISSSLIRAHILSGEIEQANKLLGRPYRIWGKVITGDGRGKTLGIPTANLQVWADRVMPKSGVYVARTQIQNKDHGAVVNIGIRPTFENLPTSSRVEAHILDFEGDDIYNERIFLDVLAKLREERKFSSADSLVNQIKKDIVKARNILSR